jgi:hypothetical protein
MPRPRAHELPKVAVIREGGTGDKPEYAATHWSVIAKATFPSTLGIMLGGNLDERQNPTDFVALFEQPYASITRAGVVIRVKLGNREKPKNRLYLRLNTGRQGHYTVVAKDGPPQAGDGTLLALGGAWC